MARMQVALAFVALLYVGVSGEVCTGSKCANGPDDEIGLLQTGSGGSPLAMPQQEVRACSEKAVPDAAFAASQAAELAAQAAKTKLLKAAQDEYDHTIKNIAAAKATTLDVAGKAYKLAKEQEAKIHYDNAIKKAALKAKELLYHDMKHVKHYRAKAEAEAIAETKIKMEAITRKHQADMDLEMKKANMQSDKANIAADQNFATARARVLANTRRDYGTAMQMHKSSIARIRAKAAADIAKLDAAAALEATSQTAKAAAAKKAIEDLAKATLAASSKQAGIDLVAATQNAASKKAVIDAEAANAATTAGNEAWVKTFADEMSFGAPCSPNEVKKVDAAVSR